MAKIGPSQTRRRTRRATERSVVTAAATAFKDYPLSDRQTTWDASAAEGRVRSWAGAEDGPNAKYATAFFWHDTAADGEDKFGNYKLGFVDIVDGSPVAVWPGVTAAAGAVQGARGGVKLPEGDVAGVKSHIAKYYDAAKTKYKDDSIQPPWEGKGKAEVIVASARRAARAVLTAAGEIVPKLISNFEMTRGTPAERFFAEQALEAGYTEMSCDRWPCDMRALSGDDRLVFRIDDNDRVYRLADGTLTHVRLAYDMIHIDVAGPSTDAVDGACFGLREAYPASYLMNSDDDPRVPITFWSDSPFGPHARLRKIEASTWDPISPNYTAAVRDELENLMSWHDGPSVDGQLLLWQGPPGTGKTWALRALASEWSKWAEFHYITDPDAFFVKNPSYMVDVLLSDSYMAIERESGDIYEENDPAGKWRILILEDTGELLSANAKEAYGQGLSRLLNVVDGMIGQGLRVLALVTTNDELGELHPAVSRPGRCASQIEFAPLSIDEANAWLGEEAEVVEAPITIAELFAREETGIEALSEETEEAAMSGECANCGHLASDHLGSGNAGPCTVGECDCNSMKEASLISEVFVRIRPDASNFQEELLFQLEAAAQQVGSFRIIFDQPSLEADGSVIPEAHQPGEKLPRRRPGPKVEAPAPKAEKSSGIVWTATLCPEGSPTDDGRIFAPEAIEWRQLPLTLMAMTTTSAEGGHDGAEVAGRIDRIWREGDLIRASGEFDPGDYGLSIARMVGDGTLRGVSVDLAISEMELQYKSQILDGEGNWIGGDSPNEADAPSVADLLGGSDEEVMFVVWKATIGMATVCPFQAFADATIELTEALVAGAKSPNPFLWTMKRQAGWEVVAHPIAFTASLETMEGEPGEGVQLGGFEEGVEPVRYLKAAATLSGRSAVDAGLAPASPPADWFAPPGLEELTALQVDEEGRIFGHAAAWDVCHTGFPDVCVTAPHTETNYSYFHLKEILCEDGERIACGTITLDTGHAGGRLSRAEATAHYDHTGTAVADIVVGEDEFGIWVAGAVRPGIDETQVRILRGAVLSGDWRNVAGNLELVALLAVNVPGFPVPRVKALFAAGAQGAEVLALTAAGITTAEGSEILLPKATLAQFDALRDRASGRYAELAARARASR